MESLNSIKIYFPDDVYVDARIELQKLDTIFFDADVVKEENVYGEGVYVRVFDGVCWQESKSPNIHDVNDIICELSKNAYKSKHLENLGEKFKLSNNIFYSNRIINDAIDNRDLYHVVSTIGTYNKSCISMKLKKKRFVSNLNVDLGQESMWYGIDIDITDGDFKERHSRVDRSPYNLFNKANLNKYNNYISKIQNQINISEECCWSNRTFISAEAMALIVHEAIGHMSESDLYESKDEMQCYLKLANNLCGDLNIIDSGDNMDLIGGYMYDDEGYKSKKTYIIKNGKFNACLTDFTHSYYWDLPNTGNGRATSCNGGIMVRMSNTYMMPGKCKTLDILNSLKSEIFVQHIGKIENNSGKIILRNIRGVIWNNGRGMKPVIIKYYENTWINFLKAISKISENIGFISSNISGCDKGGENNLEVSMGAPYVLLDFH